MKLDFKSAFKAAEVPALALIAVTLILALLSGLGLKLGLLSIPAQFIILAHAGYNGVKSFKLDGANAALAGAMASSLSMAAIIAANLVLISVGAISLGEMSLQADLPIGVIMSYLVIGYAISLAISPAIGAILGAIGAYIAGKK